MVDLGNPEDDDDLSVQGSEQGNPRPGIILQNDSNNHNLNTTIIVPTSRGARSEADYLDTIFIPGGSECLEEDSIALCTQIRAVDIDERLLDKLGEISPKKLREIEAGVLVCLSLQ